jgi:hypothetical protein
LHASLFAAIITTAATPNSHPDCRALLIKIVALHKLDTTALYARVATKTIQQVMSPLDRITLTQAEPPA